MKRLSIAVLACVAMMSGAGAQAAQNSPAVLNFKSCAKPVYPPAAITALREGTVGLEFLVSVKGTVADAKVDKSSGHPDLDDAARDALKLCKFVPAKKNGKAVEEWTHVQYVWTLK